MRCSTPHRDHNDGGESTTSPESGSSPNEIVEKITNENVKENLRPESALTASSSAEGNTPNCEY